MKSIKSLKAALIAATALAWAIPAQSNALPLSPAGQMAGKSVDSSSAQTDIIKVGGRTVANYYGNNNGYYQNSGCCNNGGYYRRGYNAYVNENVWARRRTARSYARNCGCNVYGGDMDVHFYGRGTPGYHRHPRGGYYMHTHSGYLHGHYYQNRDKNW